MGLSIKSAKTEKSVRELASRKGIGVTAAIQLAVDNELLRDRFYPGDDWALRLEDVQSIQRRSLALPVLDTRSDDEILGYDAFGLPTDGH